MPSLNPYAAKTISPTAKTNKTASTMAFKAMLRPVPLHGHLYNLRKSRTYRSVRQVFARTRPASVAIGLRRRPEPKGRPGFLRVDTVHQGDQDDQDGVKGAYHINVVDEVTQYQHVGTVAAISEAFL